MTIKFSVNLTLGLLLAVILFHLLIITKIIPYENTWGGRLQSDSEMYLFETISIVINLIFGFVLLMKGGHVKPYLNQRLINIILWIFLILFALNTIGNILAKTNFERSFAVLTLVFSILIWMILRNKEVKP